jgi:gliding motility-associated-like protein
MYHWNFGGVGNDTKQSPTFSFTKPGEYPVKMDITDVEFGCKSSTIRNMTVLPLPAASLAMPDSSCPGTPFIVKGSGTPGVSGNLTATVSPLAGGDTLHFEPQQIYSLSVTASVSTTYSLNVKDNNGCVSPVAFDSIYVQQPAPLVQWDTTVIIGQFIPISAIAGSNFTYTWTPEIKNLNCTNCYNPISTTTDNVTYSVTVEDIPLGCFKTINTYKVNVDPRTTVDVPTAFTPNGDGHNDVIYVDGWGIKSLNYFKIFNRWGQLLFETNDIKTGWDGRFNGIQQNMETYVYQVSAETYTKETLTKAGTFKLLR